MLVRLIFTLLICIEYVDGLYTANITCSNGLPSHIPLGNDILQMINDTARNDTRLTALETGLNMSQLCEIARDIVAHDFRLDTRLRRSLDQTSESTDGGSTVPPPPPPPLLPNKRLPSLPSLYDPPPHLIPITTNDSSTKNNQTMKNLTKSLDIKKMIIVPRILPPIVTDTMRIPAALVFAYTLQLLAENAHRQRKESCNKFKGYYEEKRGQCQFNTTLNSTLKQKGRMNLIDSNASYLIGVIGNSVSIFFLALLILIYIVFRSLRTRPGKNILCLSLAMAFSQLLQLVGLHTVSFPTICTSIGVILHWAFLVTFSWMAIISFDLLLTFAFPFKSGRYGNKNQFKIYNSTAVTFPTIVVIICVALDFSKAKVIGYGNGVCFIGGVWGNLFSFVLLVCLVMLFNTICLIATIVKLNSSQNTARAMKSGDGGSAQDKLQLCLMALKVSTLTALGWIFGFIGGLLGNIPMIYIFLLLTSSQGIFVFLAFCCNKRVYHTVTGILEDRTTTSGSRERKTLLTSTRSGSQSGNESFNSGQHTTHA